MSKQQHQNHLYDIKEHAAMLRANIVGLRHQYIPFSLIQCLNSFDC